MKEGCTEIPLTVTPTVDVDCDNGLSGAAFPVPGLFVIGPMPVKYIVTFWPGTAGLLALSTVKVALSWRIATPPFT